MSACVAAVDKEVMAKKSTRSRTDESPKGDAAPPKSRARVKKTASDGPVVDAAVANDSAGSSAVSAAAIGDVASVSMASEPSEDDIRLRAYHRYLERGGGHGKDFDDWLKAKQDLLKNT